MCAFCVCVCVYTEGCQKVCCMLVCVICVIVLYCIVLSCLALQRTAAGYTHLQLMMMIIIIKETSTLYLQNTKQ